MKANNVWAEFWRQRIASFNHPNHEELIADCDEVFPIEEDSAAKEKFEWVLSHATPQQADILNKRLEGYEVNEIAEMSAKSPGAITMQIQRLKEKILQHPKRF